MIGERTINYAANKIQPAHISPRGMDIKIAQDNSEKKKTPTKKKPASAKTATKKTAAKPAATRGRGRPAGSKNKPKVTAKKAAPKKPTTTKTAKAETQSKTNKTATNEPFTQGNEAMKTWMASGTISSEMTKKMTEEMMSYGNKAVAKNMELSKEFLACRTISDFFEIQNQFMRNNLDSFFQQSSKMSEMLFKASSETSAPFNSSLTEMADEWRKKMAG